MNELEERMAATLAPFGWTCSPEFWSRYYSDPWVFNLANAVERLSYQLDACRKGRDALAEKMQRLDPI